MKRKQSNYLSMFMAVETVFLKYEEPILALPAAAESVTNFRTVVADIKATRLIQDGHTTGTTKQKQKEEAEMIEATLRVAGIVYVYALDINDLVLLEKVSLKSRSLNNIGDAALLSKCTLIFNTASTIEDATIANYGLTPELLEQLKKEIADFGILVTKPRSEIITRSQATSRLVELFSEANGVLRKRIDKLMLVLQLGNPVFYNEYKAARIIVDLHGSSKASEEEEEEEEI